MKLKIRSLFILGILEVLLPFSGFPDSWKTFFSMFIGIIICGVTYLLHLQVKSFHGNNSNHDLKTESYSENGFSSRLKEHQDKNVA
jgi:amino acid permease